MKTEIKISVRAYRVQIKDVRTGEKSHDTIVLTKEQLRAGAMFDLGDEDIIYRTYNRQGFRVLEIDQAHKVELTVDLLRLYHEFVADEYLEAEEKMVQEAACDAE